MRHASLVGWLGVVALIFAAVSFVLGAFSGDLFRGGIQTWFMWANLAAGLLLIGVGVFANFEDTRERLRTGGARRAGKYGTNALLQAAIAIGILALLAFLSTRYHTRWDWTEAQAHSLTSQSQKVLAGLEQPAQIAAIYQGAVVDAAREFLARYEHAAGDKLAVSFIDPNRQPGLLAGLGVDPAKVGAGLLHVTIGAESVDVEELSEEALTNAFVKLTRLEQKKVYFLDGHNERPIEGEGADAVDGFADAAQSLRNENYEVETLLLAATGDVPDDADVVIAAAPTRPYHADEHAALGRWVATGGALLVLMDPRAKTDLEADLTKFGVSLGDDVILDQVQALFGRPTTPFAAEYADHPITGQLGESVLFNTARSVAPAEGSGLDVLVRTGETSWAERDMERLTTTGQAEPSPEEDLMGPVPVMLGGEVRAPSSEPLAEGAEAATPAARLVVIGDSDFATNQLIREFANRDLFVNSVNWLLGDVEAISIRPGKARASRLQLTADVFENIRLMALFAVPELIALLGVGSWWSRRRAPGR